MKRIISIILVASLLLQMMYGIVVAEDGSESEFLDYYDKHNAFIMLTDVPMATNGVAFRTVGVKLTAPIQNGEALTIYMPMIQEKETPYINEDEHKWVKTEFHINLSDIYNNYKTFYGNDDEKLKGLETFFSGGGIMGVDAILAPVLNGQVQGRVTNASKDLQTGYSGTIYRTFDEFNASPHGWQTDTRKAVSKDYYNRKIKFDPQPVGRMKPIITRLNSDNTHEQKSEYIFKEGEVITLDGVRSEYTYDILLRAIEHLSVSGPRCAAE